MAEAAALAIGEVIAGKYRIEGILGSGGMATVFSAWHEELEQRVALKMLHAGLRSDPMVVKRFVREARNAARIQSEHVARIMDVGRMDDDRVYIVMEYLEGHDLSKVLKARGPLPVEDVVEYLVQACDAIAVGHAMGIVHRDLKPANLFLTHRIDGSSCVKVLDFGIAKAFDAPEAGELTSTTAVIGSPRYMAPEQMANARDVDLRADVWSLGVIAYRLLTRELPFHGDNLVELAMNVASRTPKSLRSVRPDVPPALESAIMRCLERDPQQRFAEVGSFVQAIAAFGPPTLRPVVDRVVRVVGNVSSAPLVPLVATGEHEIFKAAPSNPPSIHSRTSPTLTAPSTTSLPLDGEAAPNRRGLWVAVSIVAVLALGGGAFLATRSNGAAPQAATPEPPTKSTASAAKIEPSVEPSASAPPAATADEPAAAPAESAAPIESAAPVASASAAPIATALPKTPGAGSLKVATPKPTGAAPSASAKGGKTDVWGWGE